MKEWMLFSLKEVRLKDDLVGNPGMIISVLAPNEAGEYRLGVKFC